MKLLSQTLSLIGLCLVAGVAAQSSAASTVTGDLPARPGEDGQGIGYTFQMYLDPTAGPMTETWSGSVGSKAWSDPSNPVGPLGIPYGWTHTSNWAYFSLQSDATVQISLAPNGSDLVPAFTLWRGADNSGGNFHTYTQNGVPAWVDAPGFSTINYVTTGPGPFAGQNATLSLFLTAGDYTVAIGGNDTVSAGHPAAYSFTVNASPVPLPAAVYLFGSALAGLAASRRRNYSRVINA
jgi:hypothetical protein